MTREELLEQARAHAQAASDQSFDGDRPTILALHAIRLTIAAALAPPAAVEETPESRWLVLELVGDEKIAGLVTEVLIAGAAFLEVVQPAMPGVAERRVVYSPAAILSLREITEAWAQELIRREHDHAAIRQAAQPY